MKHRPIRYAMAPPFPSLAGAPPLTPSNVSFRSSAELAHVRHDDGLSAQTVLDVRLTWRTAPSDVRGDPRGSRNASLRKDGVMACSFCFKRIALPDGRTFPESRLRSRLVTHSARTNAPEDNLRCLSAQARVRRLSEAPSRKWVTARSGAGRETVFR